MLKEETLKAAVNAYYQNNKNHRMSAEFLGIKRTTFSNQLQMAFDRGFHLSDGALAVVERTKLNPREAKGGWLHDYDNDGKKIGATRWSAPEISPEDWADRLATAMSSVKPVKAIKAPERVDKDLLTIYPIADAHIGMKACQIVTGAEYNTGIAVERLRKWVCQSVASSPPSETAIILGVGDLLHADDSTNATPRSKHHLDVDTDIDDTTDATIEALCVGIEAAAAKHKKVIVRILPGNHDPHSHIAVKYALFERYRNNPRIIVDKSKVEFFLYGHGKKLIISHHGEKGSLERIVMMIPDVFPKEWAAAVTRTLFTGHKHHELTKEVGGVICEQLRAMTGRDKHAAVNAFTSSPEMQAITYHVNGSEFCRFKVGLFND